MQVHSLTATNNWKHNHYTVHTPHLGHVWLAYGIVMDVLTPKIHKLSISRVWDDDIVNKWLVSWLYKGESHPFEIQLLFLHLQMNSDY